MNSENIQNSIKIEKLYMQIVTDLEDTYSGIFLKGVTYPETVEKSKIFRASKYFNEIFQKLSKKEM
jgi:hypothetical protein